MHYNCQECTRLWNEYALATRHFLKLEGMLQMASVSRDLQAVEEISPALRRAAAERARLKNEIASHESRAREMAAASS